MTIGFRYFLSAPLLLAVTTIMPVHASAEDATWLSRCSRSIGGNNAPEQVTYGFSTLGKADKAQGRASLTYTATNHASTTVYPTAAKDLMSQYSGATLSVGYQGLVDSAAPHASKPKIGTVSIITSGRNGKPLAGHVTLKLVVDGKAFGPYEPQASSVESGLYSVWLDTAQTDGDSAPPVLSAKKFAELAKAVDAMKAARVIVLQDRVEVAYMDLPLASFKTMRDGLPEWAAGTRARVTDRTWCLADDRDIN